MYKKSYGFKCKNFDCWKKKFFKNSIDVLSAGSFIHVLLLILKLFHAFHNNSGHFAL